MSKKTVYFIGLLSNANSSILKVKLEHGFKIESMPDTEGFNLISILRNLPSMEVGKLLMNFACLNYSEKKIYFISNSFESDIEMNKEGLLTKFPNGLVKFDGKLVHGYLDPSIQLMRLFKEGHIFMPCRYYYIIENGIPKSFFRTETHRHISQEPYILETSEVQDLQKFMQNTKLPFNKSFLQLTFENFELSYQIHNLSLSFLALMISLETLFNPGEHELKYRISRNTAVLLGKNRNESRDIFSEIKKLYDNRSNIVHSGKSDIIEKEDVLKLRHYVREAIKEINKIDKDKDELMKLLNVYGFGEGVVPN